MSQVYTLKARRSHRARRSEFRATRSKRKQKLEFRPLYPGCETEVNLTTQQAYAVLAAHGSCVTEVCDTCSEHVGPVRDTRKGNDREMER